VDRLGRAEGVALGVVLSILALGAVPGVKRSQNWAQALPLETLLGAVWVAALSSSACSRLGVRRQHEWPGGTAVPWSTYLPGRLLCLVEFLQSWSWSFT